MIESDQSEWIGELLFLQAPTGRSEMIGRVLSYYERLRAGRPFPRRNEIDATELNVNLPYISIVGYQPDPFRIQFRLIGTEIERHYGGDVKGRWLDEMDWRQKNIDDTALIYRRVHQQRQPLYGLSIAEWETRTDHVFEWAVFPLSDDGVHVTHALSVDDYTMITPQRRRGV